MIPLWSNAKQQSYHILDSSIDGSTVGARAVAVLSPTAAPTQPPVTYMDKNAAHPKIPQSVEQLAHQVFATRKSFAAIAWL